VHVDNGVVALVLLLVGLAGYVWREDILRTALDPKQPFQTYRPPPAPDYGRASAWALLPAHPERAAATDPPADVFFVHPTTYDGGRDWNAPIDEPNARRLLERVMLPNYAGPFQTVGRVFAPRYRSASLYTFLTHRDDAREARAFAYGDVRHAFDVYLARYNTGRPLLLVGVEQGGGELAARLLDEVVARDPKLVKRLAGAYLIEALVPAERYGPTTPVPACARRDQARCVVAYSSVRAGDSSAARNRLDSALVWGPGGRLVDLDGREALCVNPLTGATSAGIAPAKLNLGAANASDLEWGARPAFLPREVSAECRGGVLWVSRPSSPSLRPSGSWADRHKAAAFNLFYADLEADAKARVSALTGGPLAPPLEGPVAVKPAPIHAVR